MKPHLGQIVLYRRPFSEELPTNHKDHVGIVTHMYSEDERELKQMLPVNIFLFHHSYGEHGFVHAICYSKEPKPNTWRELEVGCE